MGVGEGADASPQLQVEEGWAGMLGRRNPPGGWCEVPGKEGVRAPSSLYLWVVLHPLLVQGWKGRLKPRLVGLMQKGLSGHSVTNLRPALILSFI